MKQSQTLAAIALLAAVSLGSGCTTATAKPVSPPSAQPTAPAPVADPAAAPAPAVTKPADTKPADTKPAWVTPVTDANFTELVAKHRPNELGKVLILEYHHFGDEEERWTRRRDNFRKDLQTLYDKGYRAVNLLDYLNGRMPLPAGTSPVIFTFDDGLLSQFKLAGGEADPESAVGIMLQFQKEHPDFGAAGTFYVNFTPVPFRETENWEEKVKFLVAHGFELANHTLEHENLGELSDEGVRKELAEQVARLRKVLPDYDGSTLALPFGAWPRQKALATEGEWQGVSYKHRAVLLVGADPVHSPYDRRLDVMALPRVQAIDSEFERWFPYLETHRYISDGDPDTIVIPETMKEYLNSTKTGNLTLRTYKSE